MGMSSDFGSAIKEGATMIRIGTAIFGSRKMIKEDLKIGFIGAGNMASALISGLIQSNHSASCIMASSPEQEHLNNLSKTLI